jgi:RNA recognition motif-containing protein
MNTRLHVGNLSYNTTEAQLRELFSQAGRVKSVTRSVDRATNLMRNFAFIEMETASEALQAIQLLNGHDVDGHTLKVSAARPREGNSGTRFDRGRGHRGRPR